jgi:hypothetical protein
MLRTLMIILALSSTSAFADEYEEITRLIDSGSKYLYDSGFYDGPLCVEYTKHQLAKSGENPDSAKSLCNLLQASANLQFRGVPKGNNWVAAPPPR